MEHGLVARFGLAAFIYPEYLPNTCGFCPMNLIMKRLLLSCESRYEAACHIRPQISVTSLYGSEPPYKEVT